MGKIINVNCIKSPEFIDNNSVDLFFQDPPYFTTSIDWDNQWKNNEEYYAWCKLWISDMYDQKKTVLLMFVVNGYIVECIK